MLVDERFQAVQQGLTMPTTDDLEQVWMGYLRQVIKCRGCDICVAACHQSRILV